MPAQLKRRLLIFFTLVLLIAAAFFAHWYFKGRFYEETDNAYVQGDELATRTRAFVLDKVEAIVLMSDGVSDPKFKSDRALETREAWDTLMLDITAETGFDVVAPGLAEGLEARLLDWLGFWVPGEHDDRTIAIIW